MTRYDIKCAVCNKTLGFVDNPENSSRAISGYYCGSPSKEGSCAAKWQSQLQKESTKRESEVFKEKLKQAIKELKASGEVLT